MDNDISTQFYGSLQVGCHESIINDHEKSVLMCYLCHRADIGDGHQRICGAFYQHCLNIGGYVLFKGSRVFCIGDCIIDIEMIEYLVQQSECTAVNIGRYQDPVACVQQAEDSCFSRKSAGKGKSRIAAFKLGYQRLKSLSCGVACP